LLVHGADHTRATADVRGRGILRTAPESFLVKERALKANRPDSGTAVSVDMSVRVRYAETDQMGIVYYANYFVWFELGRTELLRQRGYTYRQVEAEDGCFIVVADARCTYRSPARYDDLITIRTRVVDLRSRVVVFGYELLGEDGRLIATGETTHVITDRQGKPRALPEKFRNALSGS
jgi:acyl-CoA thioester hydrolase